jgi:hypothetical protein
MGIRARSRPENALLDELTRVAWLQLAVLRQAAINYARRRTDAQPAWGHCFCDSGYFFCECPCCGLVGIEFDGRAERLICPETCPRPRDGVRDCNANSPRLLRAYAAAWASGRAA